MTPGDPTHTRCPKGHAVPGQLDRCPVCGEAVGEQTTGETAGETRGRSLWDVMGRPQDATPTDTADPDQQQTTVETTGEEDGEEHGVETGVDHDTAGAQRPKGLWDLMQHGDEAVHGRLESIDLGQGSLRHLDR